MVTVALEDNADAAKDFADELAQDFGPSSPIAEASKRKRKCSDVTRTLQGEDVVETQSVRGHTVNIIHRV